MDEHTFEKLDHFARAADEYYLTTSHKRKVIGNLITETYGRERSEDKKSDSDKSTGETSKQCNKPIRKMCSVRIEVSHM